MAVHSDELVYEDFPRHGSDTLDDSLGLVLSRLERSNRIHVVFSLDCRIRVAIS